MAKRRLEQEAGWMTQILVIRRAVEEPWLALLADGWRLAEADACHLEDHHARYTVLLWRLGP